ncbi:hypothetical protein EC847_1233 [Scandinavium goeteborgense]|uniref:Uncharacterized protein n=1 Tax=Scandinavium goeteborgense TaxID=1851514 RepID=A0A4R6DW26_SCAGO|nr:hypothetical protein EC847_1233 [Scandinavium goeteborgense]
MLPQGFKRPAGGCRLNPSINQQGFILLSRRHVVTSYGHWTERNIMFGFFRHIGKVIFAY